MARSTQERRVSLIGVGGSHIGKPKDENESIRIIRSAIDHGVNFKDNSWDYNEGKSEIRMGKALRDGYRRRMFLMTKVDGRTKEAAATQIDQSLARSLVITGIDFDADFESGLRCVAHISAAYLRADLRPDEQDRFSGGRRQGRTL